MPIYEYSCGKCGHEFEALQRMGDKSCPPCEKCGSGRTKRQFSSFAMHGGSRSGGGHAHGAGCGCGSGHGSGGGGGCGGCSKSSCAGCRH
ncbi:MAG TPA: zinc ribbon domain-containing protein [Planctomycetota bacterium]|nr:zinc ribbon domain-containing protein [Planctomycetota bacterium]